MIFVIKSIQNWGLCTTKCKRDFGRGSLGADPNLVGGEVSSLSERRKMMEEGRSSRYSSQGGSALGAEPELFDEDSNDLFEIVFPSMIRPPLIY
jgi:hypothetical protein